MNSVPKRASKNLLIQQKEVVSSNEYIMSESLQIYSYDDEWYFGVADYILADFCDVIIKFLQSNGPAAQFFAPSLEDTCWIPKHDIITKVDPLSYGSTG